MHESQQNNFQGFLYHGKNLPENTTNLFKPENDILSFPLSLPCWIAPTFFCKRCHSGWFTEPHFGLNGDDHGLSRQEASTQKGGTWWYPLFERLLRQGRRRNLCRLVSDPLPVAFLHQLSGSARQITAVGVFVHPPPSRGPGLKIIIEIEPCTTASSDWATFCLEILLRADHASWHSHLM